MGSYTVSVTGAGSYVGTVESSFKITPAASSVKLAAQTKTYTGKALAYSGRVTRSGSGGKVTYAYYSDAACKRAVKAANVKAAGAYSFKKKAAGTVTYARVAKGSSRWLPAVNKKTGAITVKAGAPRAKTQSVKVKVK